MSDEAFSLERLHVALAKAMVTLQEQANDENMPSYVRKQSAHTLQRYQRALKRYPFLQPQQELKEEE